MATAVLGPDGLQQEKSCKHHIEVGAAGRPRPFDAAKSPFIRAKKGLQKRISEPQRFGSVQWEVSARKIVGGGELMPEGADVLRKTCGGLHHD